MLHPCNLCSLQFATEEVLGKHVTSFHIKPDTSRVQPILPVVLEKIKIEPELIRLDEEDDADHQTAGTIQKQLPKALFGKPEIPQIVKRLKPKDSYQCEVCLQTFSLLRYFRKHLAISETQGFFKCHEYYKTNINNGYLPLYNKSCLERNATAKDGQTPEKEQSRQRIIAISDNAQTSENLKDEERVMIKPKVDNRKNKQRSDFIDKQRSSNIVDNNMHFQRGPKNNFEIIRAVKRAGKAVNNENSTESLMIPFENQSELEIGNTDVQMPILNTTETTPTPQVTSCKECHLTCASYEQLCVHYSKHHHLPAVVLKHVDKHELYQKYKRHRDGISNNNSFKCDTCTRNFSSHSYLEKHTASGPCANCNFSDDYLKISKNDITSSEINASKSRIHLRKDVVTQSRKPYELRKNTFSKLSLLRRHNVSTNVEFCHKCNICKRQFSSLTMLRRHKLAAHNVKKVNLFNAQQGQSKLISTPKIRKRVRQVNDTNCHQCYVCHQEFSTQPQLTRHKVTAHQINPFKCDTCPKQYSSKQKLTLHKLLAHEKFRFKCDLCKKDFSAEYYLKQHKRGAHDGSLHKCGFCLKEFEHLQNLNKHILTNHSDIRHKCELCPKEFALMSRLTIHKLIVHDGVRQKCEICLKEFTYKQHLRRHILAVHDGVRHKCELCPKTFTHMHVLKSHKLSVHDGVRYKCKSCTKSFSRLGDLNRHKRNVHDGLCNSCDICQKKFCTSGYLKQHKITVHHV